MLNVTTLDACHTWVDNERVDKEDDVPRKSVDRLGFAHVLTVIVLAVIQVVSLFISLLLRDWVYFIFTGIVVFVIWFSSRNSEKKQ